MWQEPFRASASPRELGQDRSDTRPGPRASAEPLLAVPPTRSALRTGLLWRFEVSAFSLWPRLEACGILVPQPGVEAAPPAPEARSLNLWTAGALL